MKKNFKFIFSLSFAFIIVLNSKADEGMWLPLLLKKLNEGDMQKAGLKLTADDIYNINKSSLKDAIVQLGGFCTAEVISGEGLLLTNHHCAYDAIQSHSSVKNDYLTNGFWAMTREEELPNQGLTASFLVRMEDVTARVLAAVTEDMNEQERISKIKKEIAEIKAQAIKDTYYNADVKSMFDGNEYYLFVYETYRDVRLVGAPPSSIGKFGGDTDNWMWPRHTGDFALLRIYTGPDGKPADYSKDNVPLKPRHFLPVSLKGVQQNDFAMIMGYPGSTDRYLTSFGVKQAIEKDQPARVKIREERLRLMKEDMDKSDEVRIKYSSKYAQVSNYWKYFKGQTEGLKRLKVYDKKKQLENDFLAWVAKDEARLKKYGSVISDFEKVYENSGKYILSQVYLQEAAFGSEIILFSLRNMQLNMTLAGGDKDAIAQTVEGMKAMAEEHFKDYNTATDQKVTAALLKMYYEDVPADQHPEIFNTIKTKYKGDFNKYVAEMFAKSVFATKERYMKFLENPSAKVLAKDPAFVCMQSIITNAQMNISPKAGATRDLDTKASRLFIAGLREMQPEKKFYPDANFTMRLTYGNVLDYYPRDAVYYNYYTTLEGIMEKEDPKNDEFVVPSKLKELYKNKDYGMYADKDGKLRVCFITNNDITGGNSGSPVIDGEGNLIGCAFDGNWEAMSGDIAFEPELQRTIVVDSRYILFIIDKFAGAGHLVKEMKIVQ
jgi:hypothetical protein